MAKAGKLGKLLKKMQSIGRTSSFNRENDHHHRRSSTSSSTIAAVNTYDETVSSSSSYTGHNNNLCPVYVGKCRRRYMVSTDVVDHPLFRELVERSTDTGGAEDISVNCEVVLFEHMLWMLENADPQAQPEPLDELVDFYAY